jgi:hypothetical protein
MASLGAHEEGAETILIGLAILAVAHLWLFAIIAYAAAYNPELNVSLMTVPYFAMLLMGCWFCIRPIHLWLKSLLGLKGL